MGQGSVTALALCALFHQAGAQAQASECSSERFIVLDSRGLEPALFNEVRTDLAAELAHRGIDICDADATEREPAARATLSTTDATVIVELDDRLTHKRVGRDLTLAKLPANGRALAIAIAIDELLRASWAELTLQGREPSRDYAPRESPPAYYFERRTVNARGVASPVPTQLTLGGELGYLHDADSFNAFSLGARATVRAWQRGWFTAGLAGLASAPAHSSLGNAVAAGLRIMLTAGVCARERRRAFACGGARAEVDYLALRGVAPQMARTRVQHAGVVQLAAVGMLGFPLAEDRTLFTEVTLGGVPVGAKATDGMGVVMGVSGLMVGANLGLEFEL